ncbi:MAG: hypothetical protein IKO54_00190 [Lachnospiraceae bacterium]|nr:hypothetical protein [Lachnospiraceae bacterium]MBR4540576.1 hypothetical protein [Lachnospiraceae bacterium]
MKKIVIMILVIFAGLLNGCAKADSKPSDAIIVYGAMGTTTTYSDLGVFENERGILYYFDPVTGIRAPLCSKVNCKHEGYGSTNPHPTCDAFFAEMYNSSAIVRDHLYYVAGEEGNELFVKGFYRADKDGTNRKLLYRAENTEIFTLGTYEDNYFIYLYYNQEDQNGLPLEKIRLGMILLDLETEEITDVDFGDTYGGRLLAATVKDDKVYIYESYFTEDISKIDFGGLSAWEREDYNNSFLKEEIWEYNIKTGEKRKYCEIPSDSTFCMIAYGHMFTCYDNRMILQELGNDTVYEIAGVSCEGYSKCLFDSGVLFSGNGKVLLWENGTRELKEIGTYDPENRIYLTWVTPHWVYGNIFGTAGNDLVCFPREEFMKGSFEYKVMDNGE